ncbi:fasciclin domain-containing protein [Gluconacetobacter sp. Hr-1-5]|uniref:fasciclin domain-containing protein n=1 Tax=Gluconacetobacter sp. Hr-1-5 TaxID=3395370 RepID=UPI003B51C6DE
MRAPLGVMACLMACSVVACAPAARQDAFLVRGDSRAAAIPTVSVEHSYTPALDHGRPDSQVAYGAPDTPIYRDRPLNESLRGSIELADYTRALDLTGMMAPLREAGPFTVFAVSNLSMEQFARASDPSGGIPAPAALRQALAYSIVRGAYPAARLRQLIAVAPGNRISLPTVAGGTVLVGRDPAGRLVLSDGAGRAAPIWIDGMPQSNGVLYLTSSLLAPV